MAILQVKELSAIYLTGKNVLRAVNKVSFQLNPSEVMGIVGESGSGKTTLALSIMKLLSPPGYITGGSIFLDGEDILMMPHHRLRDIRGRKVSIIFQEPMSALNPVIKIGVQICEVVKAHLKIDSSEAKKMAVELLRKVHIPHPDTRFHSYPHQLSGGMRQRIMIAIAVALNPKLLIADEPTTAVDVTVQLEILRLLKNLKDDIGMAILLISHDLGVVASMADKIGIMYSGFIVECGSCEEIFFNPLHPYTRMLIENSRPSEKTQQKSVNYNIIKKKSALPSGCPYEHLCKDRVNDCQKLRPELTQVKPEHYIMCYKWSRQ